MPGASVRSPLGQWLIGVVVVDVFHENDDGGGVIVCVLACVRACVVCPRCSSRLPTNWRLAALLGSRRVVLLGAAAAALPCLLPPIYPSSLLKGFSFLFAAHRGAYTYIEKALRICACNSPSTNKCSAHTSRPARCMPRAARASAATNLAVYVLQDGCVCVSECTWPGYKLVSALE